MWRDWKEVKEVSERNLKRTIYTYRQNYQIID